MSVNNAHRFITGRDGIKRCDLCKITKEKGGKEIPTTAICPILSPSSGLELPQYKSRVDVLLIEMGMSPLTACQIG